MSEAKLVKKSGQYYLIQDSLEINITDIIEKELEARRLIDAQLRAYARDLNSAATSRAAEYHSKFVTLRKHTVLLLGLSKACVDAYSNKDFTAMAINMDRLEKQITIIKNWLQQIKM